METGSLLHLILSMWLKVSPNFVTAQPCKSVWRCALHYIAQEASVCTASHLPLILSREPPPPLSVLLPPLSLLHSSPHRANEHHPFVLTKEVKGRHWNHSLCSTSLPVPPRLLFSPQRQLNRQKGADFAISNDPNLLPTNSLCSFFLGQCSERKVNWNVVITFIVVFLKATLART